jgi:AcrR family transcriptional regulator
MSTKAKILDKGLEMFNERGIEYVGLRELAAALNIRVGNITYYFPTKDDLVYQLSLQLSQLNTDTIIVTDNLTLKSFLEMLNKVFLNHLKYRCLFLSFVHLMQQNKLLSASYKKTQAVRNATLKSNIEVLAGSGYLSVKDDGEKDFLVSALALINRFWISEAAISFRNLSEGAQLNHYLSIIAKLLLPYSTATGKKDIQNFLKNLGGTGAV